MRRFNATYCCLISAFLCFGDGWYLFQTEHDEYVSYPTDKKVNPTTKACSACWACVRACVLVLKDYTHTPSVRGRVVSLIHRIQCVQCGVAATSNRFLKHFVGDFVVFRVCCFNSTKPAVPGRQKKEKGNRTNDEMQCTNCPKTARNEVVLATVHLLSSDAGYQLQFQRLREVNLAGDVIAVKGWNRSITVNHYSQKIHALRDISTRGNVPRQVPTTHTQHKLTVRRTELTCEVKSPTTNMKCTKCEDELEVLNQGTHKERER